MQKTRTFIGTHFETSNWQDTITKVYETGKVRAIDAQLELCPTTQREHIQIKIWMPNTVTITAMQKILKCCWTPVGKDNCPDYAIKEETRIEGPIQLGNKPTNFGGDRKSQKFNAKTLRDYKGDLEDLTPFQAIQKKKLEALYPVDTAYRGKRCVVYLYGKPGAGKSRWATTRFPDYYDKSINKWWDGYCGQDVVLMDDFDKQFKDYHGLKRWMDSYKVYGEVKGGNVALMYRYFIITSNYAVNELTDDVVLQEAIGRRYKFINTNNEGWQDELDNYIDNFKFDF